MCSLGTVCVKFSLNTFIIYIIPMAYQHGYRFYVRFIQQSKAYGVRTFVCMANWKMQNTLAHSALLFTEHICASCTCPIACRFAYAMASFRRSVHVACVWAKIILSAIVLRLCDIKTALIINKPKPKPKPSHFQLHFLWCFDFHLSSCSWLFAVVH